MNTESDQHARCIESLPALLGGSLSASETSALLAHTQECDACRAELEFAQRVHTYFVHEWDGSLPLLEAPREQAAFDRLWARITANSNGTTRVRPSSHRRFGMPAALAATLLIATGALWYSGADAPDYRTLADPSQRGCSAIRVQVAPGLPADSARLFETVGARVVDGSSATGVYTLDATDRAESLRRLRALPDVRLAEPTDC
jgi:anti-sigma factor RsiW